MSLSSRLGVVVVFALAVSSCGSQAVVVQKGDAGSGGARAGSGGSSGSPGTSSDGGAAGAGTGGMAGTANPAGRDGQLPIGGSSGSGGTGGAGGGGARGTCGNLNSMECAGAPGCSVRTCPSCSGGTMFAGCFLAAGPIGACAPLAGCPAGCSGLTEASCRANPACRADSCPRCDATPAYVGCSAIVSPPPMCAGVNCPITCDQLTSLDSCDSRSDCHSVFFDSQLCGCATVGCCAHFVKCAFGARATCTAVATVACPAPPHCEGPYVVGYTTSCFEGCVKNADCAP
jgi:hypothetical protein